MVAAMLKLKDIPGVVSVTAGENFSARSEGYGIGCTMVFQDRDAMAGYGPHELHQSLIANHIRVIGNGTLLLDYEH
jgi:hypothetical protein